MPLSNEDKLRIREEEEFREQVRREKRLKLTEANRWKMYVFWVVLGAAAVLLYAMVRSH